MDAWAGKRESRKLCAFGDGCGSSGSGGSGGGGGAVSEGECEEKGNGGVGE